MYICRTAACDDTFLNCCSCCRQRILHTELCFLHLSLGCSANTDNSYTACQLCKTLLQFFFIKLRSGLCDLSTDLGNSCSNLFLVAAAVNDDGVLLLYFNRFRTAKLFHGGIFQFQTKLLGDNSTAGQDSQVF